MIDNSERDLCIRKDFTSQRNIARIPIICNQIKRLWVRYRRDNDAVGFYYITNMLQSLAHDNRYNGGTDPFYWEEDRWYDFIDHLVETKEGLSNPYLSMEQLQVMGQIVKYFEDYWKIYPDLRLAQIFTLFDEVVGENGKHEYIGVSFWRNILAVENIKVLTELIARQKDNVKQIENDDSEFFKLGGLTKEQYIDILNASIVERTQQLDFLKKEYGM